MVNQLPPMAIPIVKIATVFITAMISIKISESLINRVFSLKGYTKLHFDENKKKTLTSLLKSIVRYVVYFVAGINILEIIGIKTASLLTAAGIGGIAVGFGAQNLVKDVISGFFIIFENQYNVGDYIETAGLGGTVEELGLRTTQLRDFGGQIHIIPNGQISLVTNHSRGVLRALVKVSIAYEEDLDRALAVLDEVAAEVKTKDSNIIEGPSVLGISDLDSTGVEITIIARTVPLQQWSVERQLRKAILDRFEREGIEIPYPRRVYISREQEKGGGH